MKICPKCGASNPATSTFCSYCGSSLSSIPVNPTATPMPQPSAAPSPSYYGTTPTPSYSGYAASFFERENMQRIDRTKTGLLLAIIGALMGWLPIVGGIGGLLIFIGAILVIVGRHAFGPAHARNILWSVIICVIGVVATIVAIVAITLSAVFSNFQYFNGTLRQNPSTLGINTGAISIALIVLAAILGIAGVLFTYALQKENGRLILWIAYVSYIASAIVDAFLLNNIPYMNTLAEVVPAVLFAYAFYLARERIVRREIPAPMTSPTSPGTSGPPTPPHSPY